VERLAAEAGGVRTIEADFAVLGAGSGGLSAAAGAAQLGQSTVLFEPGEMGGECLNTGCVPSKALIAAGAAAQAVREAGRWGVRAGEPEIDFAAVMAHVRGAIEAIAPHDSQARFEGLGCTVVRERARFVGPDLIESESVRVRARRIVIATGSRPALPPVEGLAETPHLTNETVFQLTELPRRMLVLGAGPIGLELGQAFRRLGSEVVVLEAGQPIGLEDRDLVEPVLEAIRREGVDLRIGAKAASVECTAEGVAVTLESGERLEGSHLLVAAGRRPNVEGLDLEAAGVAYTKKGVTTDKALRTSNRRVYAVGDVTGRPGFTHAAGAQAALVVRRTLFAQPVDVEKLVIARVVYTGPEIAAVGLTEAQARAGHGDEVRVETVDFYANDRAIAEGDTIGFAKLITGRGGRILGVGMVGKEAGELIQPWVLALAKGLKLRQMTGWAPPYPTRGDVTRALASQWYAPVLFSDRTRWLVSLLRRFA